MLRQKKLGRFFEKKLGSKKKRKSRKISKICRPPKIIKNQICDIFRGRKTAENSLSQQRFGYMQATILYSGRDGK